MKELIFFIVDDDPFFSSLIVKKLNLLGHSKIEVFNTGFECIVNLKMNPSIIILDYQMEKMNGLDILKEIKRVNPSTHMVMVSSQEKVNIALELIENGALSYIQKSSSDINKIDEVIRKIEKSYIF
jgi:DNA-binding NarL/FixJ family response regulator